MDDSRHQSGAPQGSVDATQVRRWAELFALILAEFKADGRDPTARIEGDYSTRTIRIVRATERESGVTRTLTPSELAKANLRDLARRLYADSKLPARD